MGKVYAVRKGRQSGLYETWSECSEQVTGFSGAEYKGFKSRAKATAWLAAAADKGSDDASPHERSEAGVGTDSGSSANVEAAVDATESASDTERGVCDGQQDGDDPEEDIGARREAKALTFIRTLEGAGVAASLVPTNSAHYHRIGFEGKGFADLYLTAKKPFELHLRGVNDSELRDRVGRLWRQHHWGVGQSERRERDAWEVVRYYYETLKPFAHLSFDFAPLAQALTRASKDAPSAESIRYDFRRIEQAYLELKPQSNE